MPQLVEPMTPVQRRAVKIWQVLIARASNRQTITYSELATLIGREIAARGIGPDLDRVQAFCSQRGLSDLTVTVVASDSGKPRKVTPGVDVDKERQRVFKEKWFATEPPQPEEFA